MSERGNLLTKDGRAFLVQNCFQEGYLDRLIHELDWEQESVVMFGKTIQVPRLTTYYGEFAYEYSGVMHESRRFPDVIAELMTSAELVAEFQFNSVLCNRYRSGGDGMGYHRDNEPEMDTRCIASVTFGEERKMKFRHRASKEVIDVLLPDRSILVMLDCQDEWEHQIPKSKRTMGERINLTFRRIQKLG